MARPRKYPLLTLLALAAYVAAATAGGLLHDHGHPTAAGDAAVCQHHHHACSHETGEPAGTPSRAPHDNDCSVCRFLAQPVAPVAAMEPDEHDEPSVSLAAVASDDPISRVHDRAHARAPPTVG